MTRYLSNVACNHMSYTQQHCRLNVYIILLVTRKTVSSFMNFFLLIGNNLRGCTASKLTNGLLKIRTLKSSLFWDVMQRRL